MTHTTTFPAEQQEAAGGMHFCIAEVDITSYTASGEVITAGEFNMTTLSSIWLTSIENAYLLTSNAALTLIRAYDDTFTEATSTTDIGTMRVLVFGF